MQVELDRDTDSRAFFPPLRAILVHVFVRARVGNAAGGPGYTQPRGS